MILPCAPSPARSREPNAWGGEFPGRFARPHLPRDEVLHIVPGTVTTTSPPTLRFAPFVLFVLLALPPAAAGQPYPKAPAQPSAGACHADVQRFCADAKGTPGGVATCLREHRDELSEACRNQVTGRRGKMRGELQRIRTACQDEIARSCARFTPGERGLVRCLRQHDAELSDGCRKALPERRGRGGPPPG